MRLVRIAFLENTDYVVEGAEGAYPSAENPSEYNGCRYYYE